jgi:hypothetical protein
MTPSSPKTSRSYHGPNNKHNSISNIINIGVLNIKNQTENRQRLLDLRKKIDFSSINLKPGYNLLQKNYKSPADSLRRVPSNKNDQMNVNGRGLNDYL